jgi:hypothetical protein
MRFETTDLSRFQRNKFIAEMFMLGFAILAFGWIGATLVLVVGDTELRQHILRIFGYLSLWLAVVPLFGFGVCWCWRRLLAKEISKITKGETEQPARADMKRQNN